MTDINTDPDISIIYLPNYVEEEFHFVSRLKKGHTIKLKHKHIAVMNVSCLDDSDYIKELKEGRDYYVTSGFAEVVLLRKIKAKRSPITIKYSYSTAVPMFQ